MGELTDRERMLVSAIAAICCSGGKSIGEPSVFGPGLARSAGILKKARTAADIKRGIAALTASMGDPSPPDYCEPEPPEEK